MAYARFGRDSSVYIFLATGGHLECCGCRLGDRWEFFSTQEMLNHLSDHEQAGHLVPAEALDELLADAEQNDRWITAVQEGRNDDAALRRSWRQP